MLSTLNVKYSNEFQPKLINFIRYFHQNYNLSESDMQSVQTVNVETLS